MKTIYITRNLLIPLFLIMFLGKPFAFGKNGNITGISPVNSFSFVKNMIKADSKESGMLNASYNPANEAINILPDATIQITFDEMPYISEGMGSEPLSTENVGNHVSLKLLDNTLVDANYIYDPVTFIVTITPNSYLAYGTGYRVELTGNFVTWDNFSLDINDFSAEFTTTSRTTLTSAEVTFDNPSIVTLTFNRSVYPSSGDISVEVDASPATILSVEQGSLSSQIDVHLENEIHRGEVISLSFTTGIFDLYDYVVEPASDFDVDNNIVSNECELIAFAFLSSDNPGLANDYTGNIINNKIYVSFPLGTDISALQAYFETSDYVMFVKIDGVVQTSGITPNDFTTVKTYVVTAEDGASTHSYDVKVEFIYPLEYYKNFEESWNTPADLSEWEGDGTLTTEWHRSDNSSNWASGAGNYWPTGADDTDYSARFHSYGIANGVSSSLISPLLDLSDERVEILDFYYINTSGTDVLKVYFSETGGGSWGLLATFTTTSEGWSRKKIALNSTSPEARIKFTAVSDNGSSDLGIDEVQFYYGTPPTITTSNVSGISMNKAVCGGDVSSAGHMPVTSRGVCWGINEEVTLSTCLGFTNNGTGIGQFSSSITGLSAGSIYSVRAYATSDVGTSYGPPKNFSTTVFPTPPTMSVNPASDIYTSSVYLEGTVLNDGDLPVSESGFVISTNPNPVLSDPEVIKYSTTPLVNFGSFNTQASLMPGTQYYFKSFATNAEGTSYSNEETFTTLVMITTFPSVEHFSDVFPPENWEIINPDGYVTWEVSEEKQFDDAQGHMAFMDFYDYDDSNGQKDNMISPVYNIGGLTYPVLSFYVAYAKYRTDYSDTLMIFFSTNEGRTWESSPIFFKGGDDLATDDDHSDLFVPTSTDHWRIEKIMLTPYKSASTIRFKFESVNGYGNSLYIDEITVRDASDDNKLFSLTLNGGMVSLNPIFNAEITTYTATVPAGTTTVDIEATPNDPLASVRGNIGSTDLVAGVNNLTITCIADNFSTKDYTVALTVLPITAIGSGNWSDPAIWGGTVPSPGDNVVINTGITITIPATKATVECNDLTIAPLAGVSVDGTLNVNGNLLIESDASGSGSLIDKGTLNVTGTRTSELYIAQNDRYYYVSMPVAGATASAFGDVAGADKLYYRNTPTSAWMQITNPTEELSVGSGFATKQSVAGRTIQLTGILNTGAKTINLQNSGDRWNLIGNPYPSSMDWGTENSLVAGWNNAGIRNTIYVKAGGNFAIWNATLDGEATNGGSRYIPSMQAFWVKSMAEGSRIEMNNNVRTHTGNNLMKQSETLCQKLRVKVEHNQYSDEAVLRFHSEALTETEKFDAEKMFATDTQYPQVYFMEQDEKLAINTLPLFEGVHIQSLGFKTNTTGTFTFTFSQLESFGSNAIVWLEDKLSNCLVNLNQNPIFSFESNPADNLSRFILHITDGTTHYNPFDKPSANSIESLNNHINIYSHAATIYIKAEKALHATVKVYNLLGAEVSTLEMNGDFTKIDLQASGHYVVKLINNHTSVTKKVYIE